MALLNCRTLYLALDWGFPLRILMTIMEKKGVKEGEYLLSGQDRGHRKQWPYNSPMKVPQQMLIWVLRGSSTGNTCSCLWRTDPSSYLALCVPWKSPKDGNVPLVCSDPWANCLAWEAKPNAVAGARTSSWFSTTPVSWDLSQDVHAWEMLLVGVKIHCMPFAALRQVSLGLVLSVLNLIDYSHLQNWSIWLSVCTSPSWAVLALRQDLSSGGFLICFINCRKGYNAT